MGWLSAFGSGGKLATDGVDALTVEDYRLALTFLIAALDVAVLMAFLCRKTLCQELYQ
jgi:hypothetical protein